MSRIKKKRDHQLALLVVILWVLLILLLVFFIRSVSRSMEEEAYKSILETTLQASKMCIRDRSRHCPDLEVLLLVPAPEGPGI